ncbi:MAG: hypothetical protein KTR31_31415 [Myxococcales bacterium]|nr:hypothetical protein [Myxococcales bacterium]
MGGRSGVLAALVLLVLIVAALVPVMWVVPLLPGSRDAALWLIKGDPSHPDLWEWVWSTQHFRVGYRPTTALSYTVGWVLPGGVAGQRVLDLALHAATVALTYGVARRFAPRMGRAPALAAAAVVALHPLVPMVLLNLARRAYTLTAMWTLLALWCVPLAGGVSGRGTWGRAAAAVGCAALAATSHEAGFLAFVLLAVVAVTASGGRDLGSAVSAAVRGPVLGPAVGVAVAVVALRTAVLRGVGGYRSAEHGVAEVVQATLSSAVPLQGIRWDGDEVQLWATVLSLVLFAGLVALGVERAARGAFGGEPDQLPESAGSSSPGSLVGEEAPFTCAALPLLAVVWALGLVVLYAPQGAWFPRQMIVMLPALGWLVAVALADSRAVATAIGAASLAVVIGRSGLVQGLPAEVRPAMERSSQVAAAVAQAAQQLPPGATLKTVLPRFTRPTVWSLKARGAQERKELPLGSRVAVQWAKAAAPGRRVTVVAVVGARAEVASPLVTVREEAQAVVLTRAEAGRWLAGASAATGSADLTVEREEADSWLLVHDGVGARRLQL